MTAPIDAWRHDVAGALGEGLSALSELRAELRSADPPMVKLRRALSLCEAQIQALQARQDAATTALNSELMAGADPGQYWSAKAVKEYLHIDHISIRTLVRYGALDCWQFLTAGGLSRIDPATETIERGDTTESGRLFRIDGAIFWGPDVVRVRAIIEAWRSYARAQGIPSYIGKPPERTGFVRWYKNIYLHGAKKP